MGTIFVPKFIKKSAQSSTLKHLILRMFEVYYNHNSHMIETQILTFVTESYSSYLLGSVFLPTYNVKKEKNDIFKW